jgi:serine/threonine protein phosphatase PrpC
MPDLTALVKRCPTCGARATADAFFCEVDGTRLLDEQPGEPAGRCPCGRIEDDGTGFCANCGGRIVTESPASDRVVLATDPTLAAISDRGKRHPRNEDAVAVAREDADAGDAIVLVVCDGVSSTDDAEHASRHATEATKAALVAAARAGRVDEAALAEAIGQAHEAVCAQAPPVAGLKDPSGTTIVAAVARGGRAYVGWVGDSRAYWFAPTGCGRLTRDHSWAEEMVGILSASDAYDRPEAHAITHCLGPVEVADGGLPPTPSLATFDAPPEGWLLLCTDGLWNYAPEPEQLAALLPNPMVDARAAAEALVDFALARGGHDNVTVALAKIS